MEDSIHAALRADLDPRTSVENRLHARSLLSQIEGQPVQAVEVGSVLVLRSEPDQVRHYGWRLLEGTVRLHWPSFSPEQQGSLRQLVLHLCANESMPLGQEPGFVRSKAASCLVSLVAVSWPHAWPDAVETIITGFGNGDTGQLELVLMFVRALAEVIGPLGRLGAAPTSEEGSTFLSRPLEPGQRDFLVRAFTDATDTLLVPFVENTLRTVMAQAAEPGATQILGVAVEAADALLTCCSLALGPRLSSLLPPLLVAEEALRRRASEALATFISRGHSLDGLEQSATILTLFDSLPELFAPLAEPSRSTKDHMFQLGVVDVLVELGLLQTRAFSAASKDQALDYSQYLARILQQPDIIPPIPRRSGEHTLHPRFAEFLSNMLALSQHPSLRVLGLCVSLWIAVAKAELLKDNPAFDSVAQFAISTCIASMCNVFDENAPLDYGSDEEASLHQREVRESCLTLIASLTRLHAGETWANIAQCCQQAVEWLREVTPEMGQTSMPYVGAACAAQCVFACLNGMPLGFMEGSNGRETTASATTALQAIVSVPFPGPVCAVPLLELANAFAPLVLRQRKLAPAVLHLVHQMLSYRHPAEADAAPEELSEETCAVRDKACEMLMKMGEDLAQQIVETQDVDFVSAAFAESLRPSEQCAVVGVAMAIASIAEPEAQRSTVATLLQPVIEFMSADDVAPALADPLIMAGQLGLLKQGTGPDGDLFAPEERAFRRALEFSTRNFATVVSRAVEWDPCPLSEVVGDLMRRVMILIRTVHATHALAPQIAEPFAPVFAIPEPGATPNDALGHRLPAGRSEIAALAVWWTRLQRRLYTVLGHLMNITEFFDMPELSGLADNVFTNLDHVPMHVLASLNTNAVDTLRRMCPLDARRALYEELLPLWLRFFRTRLDGEFALSQQRAGGNSDLSPEMEVLVDAVLHEAAEAFAHLVRTLALSLPSAGRASTAFLMREPMTTILFESGASLFVWPVDMALDVAISLTRGMLPLVAQPEHHLAFGTVILPAALMALTTAEEGRNIDRLMGLIRDLYLELGVLRADLVRAALMGVPGVTEERLARAEQDLIAASNEALDQAAIMRQLLKEVVGSGLLRARGARGEQA